MWSLWIGFVSFCLSYRAELSSRGNRMLEGGFDWCLGEFMVWFSLL